MEANKLKITLKAADFNTIDSGEQNQLFLDVNNKWAKKLCRSSVNGTCKGKDNCVECMKKNGFSYALYNTLSISKSSKTIDYPIISINRGFGDSKFGADENTKYFVVKFKNNGTN